MLEIMFLCNNQCLIKWNIAAYSFSQLEANHVVSATRFNILLRHYSLLLLVDAQKITWYYFLLQLHYHNLVMELSTIA